VSPSGFDDALDRRAAILSRASFCSEVSNSSTLEGLQEGATPSGAPPAGGGLADASFGAGPKRGVSVTVERSSDGTAPPEPGDELSDCRFKRLSTRLARLVSDPAGYSKTLHHFDFPDCTLTFSERAADDRATNPCPCKPATTTQQPRPRRQHP
jgi:hypothetical protein